MLLAVLGVGLVLGAYSGLIDHSTWQNAHPAQSSFGAWLRQVDFRVPIYWSVLLVGTGAMLWLLRKECPLRQRAWASSDSKTNSATTTTL